MLQILKKLNHNNLNIENRVALIYVFWGSLWIIASDKALLLFNFNADFLTQIQTYKGWFFVIITGLLIQMLIKLERKKEVKLRKDLKHAIIKSQESDRLKSAFLSNISHELRTPLNSILGFSELIKNPNLEESEKEDYVGFINEGSNQLLAILNDLIEISKLESNLTQIENKEFCIVNLIHELYPIYKFELEMNRKHDLGFDLQLHDTDEYQIKSDRFRVKQILSHLLSNAIKFTHKGSIQLGLEEFEDSISIFVQDTGIGIKKDEIDRLMQPFIQSDMDSNRMYGGVGIGLALCQELSALLKGEIQIDTEINMGTRVSLLLPKNAMVQ